jgi:hypothetical protein
MINGMNKDSTTFYELGGFELAKEYDYLVRKDPNM